MCKQPVPRGPTLFEAQLHLVSCAHSNFAPFFPCLPLRGRFLEWPSNGAGGKQASKLEGSP